MTKRTLYTGIAVTVTLVVVGVFFILGVPFSTSSLNSQATGQASANQVAVQEEAVGTGVAAKAGDTLTVNYTGKLQDGTTFDTSVGKPAAPSCPAGTKTGICFVIGSGQVIPGWDQGLMGAQAGTKRLLIIPPSLAYGPNDYGPIPGNSTLIFEVEVVSVTPAAK